jgi:hypothetical protein
MHVFEAVVCLAPASARAKRPETCHGLVDVVNAGVLGFALGDKRAQSENLFEQVLEFLLLCAGEAFQALAERVR